MGLKIFSIYDFSLQVSHCVCHASLIKLLRKEIVDESLVEKNDRYNVPLHIYMFRDCQLSIMYFYLLLHFFVVCEFFVSFFTLGYILMLVKIHVEVVWV